MYLENLTVIQQLDSSVVDQGDIQELQDTGSRGPGLPTPERLLLVPVIEKVADEPTLPLVRETFENAQESYPRIVQEFKHHLENPIPQEPTNTKKFLSSVRTKLKDTLFDAEGLYAEENCLSKDGLKSTYPNGKRLVENDREMGMRHGTDERRKMINLVLWKLIRKASHRSTSNYSEKDIIPVYERLSGVLWEELKDVDFIIFPEMDRKIGSDIFQLLSGNEDVDYVQETLSESFLLFGSKITKQTAKSSGLFTSNHMQMLGGVVADGLRSQQVTPQHSDTDGCWAVQLDVSQR
ncbi:hypothetical protein CCH79_00016616 [Gambusia affinis]|uniref:Uncharacterized protein n=1 Tax=Gambusia affinis TaxID=33528 RepID=A0A315V960_GAMAF|nr:hypothetical protein CCH79_00016616 [Gambusia affinis]